MYKVVAVLVKLVLFLLASSNLGNQCQADRMKGKGDLAMDKAK